MQSEARAFQDLGELSVQADGDLEVGCCKLLRERQQQPGLQRNPDAILGISRFSSSVVENAPRLIKS